MAKGDNMTIEKQTGLFVRLRALTEEDAGEVLANAALSDPLTAEDVLALYNQLLDIVIGEEA